MKISIKIKFSIFLATLLLLTVIILSLLVLRGIKLYQVEQYENNLARQTETANVYFKQVVLSESNKIPQIFLSTKGVDFAKQLEQLTGHTVVLYDKEGAVVSSRTRTKAADYIGRTLDYVLKNKTAYLVEQDQLYYLTPLRIGTEQIGVIQFHYSLTGDHDFYNRIKKTFIVVGAVIFCLSFLLAYIYFNFIANGIIKLEQTVDHVRKGHYEVNVLKRRDEIGRLSLGIQAMSHQIRSTLNAMEEEQEKLTLAVNKLSLLDRQQKEFIGNVTHEFKTPLTSIKAYMDLLEMYPDDEELLDTAKRNIKSETDRLYEMVDKVLQLSSLEKYDFEYQPEILDIKKLLMSVLQSLSGKLNKFGLHLETELSEAYVHADKDSILLILVNLLDNAIKYNNANGSVIVKNYIEQDKVWIEISDTGIGIPKEAMTRIFEPFYTVDKNRSRQSGGAGLGLSLVKKYVERQGGEVILRSSKEEGTTFCISLPLAQAK